MKTGKSSKNLQANSNKAIGYTLIVFRWFRLGTLFLIRKVGLDVV